jgi:hypothetical protein
VYEIPIIKYLLGVGIEVESIVIGSTILLYSRHWEECVVNCLVKIEEIHIGENRQFFKFNFGINNKGRARKKNMEAKERRLGKFWSMLEHFWSILELNIEEPGCQA